MRCPVITALPALLITLMLAVAPAAQADTAPAQPSFLGQRPAADTQTQSELAVAIAFWRDRHLTTCPDGITAFYADSLAAPDSDDEPGGRGGNCTIWLLAPLITEQRAAWQHDHDPFNVKTSLGEECSLVAHEVGHALGLEHTTTGIMAPWGGDADIPWECRIWARQTYCQRKARHVATRRLPSGRHQRE